MVENPELVSIHNTCVVILTQNSDLMLAVSTSSPSPPKLEDNVIDGALNITANLTGTVPGFGVASDKIRDRVGSKRRLKLENLPLRDVIGVLGHQSVSRVDSHQRDAKTDLLFVLLRVL